MQLFHESISFLSRNKGSYFKENKLYILNERLGKKTIIFKAVKTLLTGLFASSFIPNGKKIYYKN